MATRPVFVPAPITSPLFVQAVDLSFTWHPGFSLAQKRRNIAALHEAAAARDIAPVLEISSKSTEGLGVGLSAFNLQVQTPEGAFPLENVFQSAKCFHEGGPYGELLTMSPRDAKRDPRLAKSGKLVAFDFFGERFPLEPKTAFYDWLYLHALVAKVDARRSVTGYAGFSDIEFNPSRSLNCQARSAALFVALQQRGVLDQALESVTNYFRVIAA